MVRRNCGKGAQDRDVISSPVRVLVPLLEFNLYAYANLRMRDKVATGTQMTAIGYTLE